MNTYVIINEKGLYGYEKVYQGPYGGVGLGWTAKLDKALKADAETISEWADSNRPCSVAQCAQVNGKWVVG